MYGDRGADFPRDLCLGHVVASAKFYSSNFSEPLNLTKNGIVTIIYPKTKIQNTQTDPMPLWSFTFVKIYKKHTKIAQ